MNKVEQASNSYFNDLPFTQKWARELLLKVLAALPYGYLELRENGQLLATFGKTDDDLKANVDVLDARFYPQLLLNGSIGAGETYVNQYWRSSDVTSVIRLFARNLPLLDELERKLGWLVWPKNLITLLRRRNTQKQAKENISSHYDLGNELYTRFLDKSMMYSSAIYPKPDSPLEEAQLHKLQTICDKLELKETDHLLEIGTGWGGLAIFAAKNYGCKITTTTISKEQFEFAKAQIALHGLEDKINLILQDYRTLDGKYDKLVSIEMIEAVGKEYFSEYFSKCSSLLKPGGLLLIQSITIADQRYKNYSNNLDFIQKHVFPGGFLPSIQAISQHICDDTNLVMRHLQDIGIDYANTLKDWHQRFNNKWDELVPLGYDEQFKRLWNYYFCYCEGGFRERTISAIQFVAGKPSYERS